MSITNLEETSLDTFLALPAWSQGASKEPQTDVPSNLGDQTERERDAVRTALVRSDNGLLADAVFALRYPVEIAALLKRATAEQYAILCEICDALRGENPPRVVATFDDLDAWNGAIEATRRKLAVADHGLYDLDRFSRSHAVAAAIGRLEQKGYEINLSAFGASFDEKVFQTICKKISDEVEALGGRSVAVAVLRYFERANRIYKGSLLYGRAVDQVPQPREPGVPWHYLYNLGLKHYNSNGRGHSEARFVQLIELARDMAAVIDVESYSTFEHLNISHVKFHSSILDRVIYDELFAFPQWQPTIAPQLLALWLRHLVNEGCTLPLATLDEWTAFGGSLIAKAEVSSLLSTHPTDYVSSGLDAHKARTLCAALALKMDDVNKDYLTPLDTSKRNSPSAPLYAQSATRYVLPPRGMAGRALYEGIYRLLREAKTPQLETIMGKALELLTADAIELMGRRPDIVGAQYRLPGQSRKLAPYEVDVADDSEKRVFLFECKKKPLTNVARGGNSLTATLDFAQALLHPLVQLNRHEAQLRSRPGITFVDGRVLQLGGRDIQRIAVAMTDHGSMQDRVFVRAMILGLWGATLSAKDPAHQPAADKINRELVDLAAGVVLLAPLAGEDFNRFVRHYVHSTWWFGIDQLFFLCSQAPDLWSAISALGSITFGTGDMMTEIAHCDRIGLLKKIRERASN